MSSILTTMAAHPLRETFYFWPWPSPVLLLYGFRTQLHGACGRPRAPPTGTVTVCPNDFSLKPYLQYGRCIEQTPSGGIGNGIFWRSGQHWVCVGHSDWLLRRDRVCCGQKQPVESRKGAKRGHDAIGESETIETGTD